MTAYLFCYLDSAREDKISIKSAIINIGRASALMIALIPTIIRATFRALLGKQVFWHVTPKGSKAHVFRDIALVEILCGLSLIVAATYSIINNLFYTGMFLLIFGTPFLYIGTKTISRW